MIGYGKEQAVTIIAPLDVFIGNQLYQVLPGILIEHQQECIPLKTDNKGDFVAIVKHLAVTEVGRHFNLDMAGGESWSALAIGWQFTRPGQQNQCDNSNSQNPYEFGTGVRKGSVLIWGVQ